jgi:hypothetical protein
MGCSAGVKTCKKEGGVPETRATGSIHNGIMVGKLKGAMRAQTPRGTFYEQMTMPFDTAAHRRNHILHKKQNVELYSVESSSASDGRVL